MGSKRIGRRAKERNITFSLRKGEVPRERQKKR